MVRKMVIFTLECPRISLTLLASAPLLIQFVDVYKRQVGGGEGVICQDTPDDDAKTACEELGKKLAAV